MDCRWIVLSMDCSVDGSPMNGSFCPWIILSMDRSVDGSSMNGSSMDCSVDG